MRTSDKEQRLADTGLRFRRPRVFIIDDEEAVTELLEGYLEQADAYEISCFTDAFEGLNSIAKDRPEVALVDLKMPGMHGMQLVSDAQKVSPATSFVVISGFTTIDTLLEAIRQGVHDYLTKPFSSAEAVRLVVRNAVKKHELESQVLLHSNIATATLRLGELNAVGEARSSFFEMVREIFLRLLDAEICVSLFREGPGMAFYGDTLVPVSETGVDQLMALALQAMGVSDPPPQIERNVRLISLDPGAECRSEFASIVTLSIPVEDGIEAQLALAHSRPGAFAQEAVRAALTLAQNVGIVVQRQILGVSSEHQMIVDLLHHLKDGVVVLDRNYQIRYVNTQARRILGMSDDASVDTAVKAIASIDPSLVTPGPKHNFMAALQKQVEARVGGEARFFDVDAYAFYTPNKVAYRIVLFRDITHLRREKEKIERLNRRLNTLNDELRERNLRLEGLVKELDSFAYIASHDLQEPFRHIEIFAQFLERDLGGDSEIPDEVRYHLEQIEQNVDVARRLLGDLRTLSRITRMRNPYAAIELVDMVAEVLERFEPDFQQRKARVTVNELPAAYGDPIKLKEVFHNLIGNALKYSPRDVSPVLTISGSKIDGEVLVSVDDKGIGVDPKYHEYIFEPCRRIPHGEEVRGSGLGLAIARKIVEEHGGRLWVESTLGNGSAFRFTLPGGDSPALDFAEPENQ
jgi:signal transduction histidine kinase/FixJ family two-component response regulator